MLELSARILSQSFSDLLNIRRLLPLILPIQLPIRRLATFFLAYPVRGERCRLASLRTRFRCLVRRGSFHLPIQLRRLTLISQPEHSIIIIDSCNVSPNLLPSFIQGPSCFITRCYFNVQRRNALILPLVHC